MSFINRLILISRVHADYGGNNIPRRRCAGLIQDGYILALEGFTHLILFAAGHEIIRQKEKNLTLVRMTPDVIYDQLIGAGCLRKRIFSLGR